MLICDLKIGPARGVRPSATPQHALAMMQANGYATLPVIDANGELVGVITEPDARLLLTPTSAGAARPDLEPRVSAAMTSQPAALGLHDGLTRALRILAEVPWDALPVTNGRRLIGILTRDEAMAARGENDHLFGRPLAAVLP